jgi:hypothetical protein
VSRSASIFRAPPAKRVRYFFDLRSLGRLVGDHTPCIAALFKDNAFEDFCRSVTNRAYVAVLSIHVGKPVEPSDLITDADVGGNRDEL